MGFHVGDPFAVKRHLNGMPVDRAIYAVLVVAESFAEGLVTATGKSFGEVCAVIRQEMGEHNE